ncbi:ciliary neurotrophic factor [Clarias gariepinus]|uniref:ciliary neurotrophic factor n=1 Tax=Clarias gariepinus TaxID=13013 RepID=UPI00234C8252|nr:ciliary neurotrophic factor [Clarias gariepinus]XP_053357696.1 ciliary neurotrophic factor [Clarias gariepinus]
MALTEKNLELARLLHKECTELLKLYTARESLQSNPVSHPQLVCIPSLTQLSPPDKLSYLNAALRACLSQLDLAITREDDIFPNTPEDKYRKQRTTVRERLNFLVLSTDRLLEEGKSFDAQTKDFVDSGLFALKQWILQVLQDLVHWSNKTAETLQTLPAAKAQKQVRTRRATGKRNKTAETLEPSPAGKAKKPMKIRTTTRNKKA